jgi:hypothetical protein
MSPFRQTREIGWSSEAAQARRTSEGTHKPDAPAREALTGISSASLARRACASTRRTSQLPASALAARQETQSTPNRLTARGQVQRLLATKCFRVSLDIKAGKHLRHLLLEFGLVSPPANKVGTQALSDLGAEATLPVAEQEPIK